MTIEELTNFIINWTRQIINTEGGEDLKIIKSHQSKPAPTSPYLVVKYASEITKIGSSSNGDPDDDGNRLLINDYECQIEIREVAGYGDRLRKLINSIERQDIKDLFKVNGVAYLSEGQVMPVPRLDDSDWVRESLVEIQLGIADSITENSSWVETVDYTGEFEGMQN